MTLTLVILAQAHQAGMYLKTIHRGHPHESLSKKSISLIPTYHTLQEGRAFEIFAFLLFTLSSILFFKPSDLQFLKTVKDRNMASELYI